MLPWFERFNLFILKRFEITPQFFKAFKEIEPLEQR